MGAFTSDRLIFAPRHVLGWVLFTLSAGFVNAGALMACKNFVTHITGNVTNFAAEPPLAGNFLLVVASFVGGAMLAVLLAESLKARPRVAFALPLLIAASMLLGIAVAGKAGCFGTFGVSDELNPRAFTMLVLLAVSMGLVNTSIAAATNNQIRVTHLTGPATDLAGNIVRAALGAGRGSATELKWAGLRLAKLGAFAVGAGVAAKFSGALHYDAFAVAAAGMIAALGFTGSPEKEDEESAIDNGDADADADLENGGAVSPTDEANAVAGPIRYEDALPPLPPPAPSSPEERPDERNAAE